MPERVKKVTGGLAVMATGKGAAASVLRAALIYLLAFVVVTTVADMFFGGGWWLVAVLAGLAGILPFMKWASRRLPSGGRSDDGEVPPP
ncbi:hypothetical protein [Actinomyces howellii]|uniref:Uncharacterized protein n=1 Tax=Actinomyces howellii TaxID=52771 RepID=A0A3S4R181_9ACTO|nr:hypothetical protein [Actinomyces howellii]VEG28525.1 Uncharacterised protein [Actinomyces howellii]